MKKVILGLIVAFCGAAYGQINVPMYSTEVFSDNLYMIDTSTFTVTSTMTLTSGLGVSGINGADIDPCSGDVYVNYKAGFDRRLGILDVTTGAITDIGSFGDQVATIAFGPTGLLFAITGNGAGTSEALYEVNTATGLMTFITTLITEDDGESIGFNPDNGMLYRWSGWGTTDCVMHEIDPSTFIETPIPLSGYAYANSAGVTYIGNNTFISGNANDDDYFTITTSGVAVGPIDGGLGHQAKGLWQPNRYIQAATDVLCTTGFVLIEATEGEAHEWFLDGVSTGVTTPQFWASEAGDYHCEITIAGCVGMSNTVTLTLGTDPGPTVVLDPSPEAFICSSGGSVEISGTAGDWNQWLMDGVWIDGENSDMITVDMEGSYNLITTDAVGCSDSSATATVVTLFTGGMTLSTPDGDTYCAGDSLLLVATDGGGTYNWYMDGTLVAGADNDSIYVTSPGEYSAATMFGACSDSTASGIMVIEDPCDASIEENDGLNFSFYPNPAEEFLMVQLPETGDVELVTIEIVGLDGKVVYQKEMTAAEAIQLDVSELNAATYLIRIQTADQLGVKRFVKK